MSSWNPGSGDPGRDWAFDEAPQPDSNSMCGSTESGYVEAPQSEGNIFQGLTDLWASATQLAAPMAPPPPPPPRPAEQPDEAAEDPPSAEIELAGVMGSFSEGRSPRQLPRSQRAGGRGNPHDAEGDGDFQLYRKPADELLAILFDAIVQPGEESISHESWDIVIKFVTRNMSDGALGSRRQLRVALQEWPDALEDKDTFVKTFTVLIDRSAPEFGDVKHRDARLTTTLRSKLEDIVCARMCFDRLSHDGRTLDPRAVFKAMKRLGRADRSVDECEQAREIGFIEFLDFNAVSKRRRELRKSLLAQVSFRSLHAAMETPHGNLKQSQTSVRGSFTLSAQDSGDVQLNELKQVVSHLPMIESRGINYLRKLQLAQGQNKLLQTSRRPPCEPEPRQKRVMRNYIRIIMFVAILLGCAAGMASAVFELYVPEHFSYSIFGLYSTLFSCAATMVELSLLYSAEFRIVQRISVCLGLRLWPMNSTRAFVAAGLVRAIFELGFPSDYAFGINPRRFNDKLVFLARYCAYKGKRSVTKIMLRLIAKKIFIRTVSKALDIYVALPVNATWNLIVVCSAMRTCINLMIGPSFVTSKLSQLFGKEKIKMDTGNILQLQRAIGLMITINRHFHPTHYIMCLYLTDELMDADFMAEYQLVKQRSSSRSNFTCDSDRSLPSDRSLSSIEESKSAPTTDVEAGAELTAADELIPPMLGGALPDKAERSQRIDNLHKLDHRQFEQFDLDNRAQFFESLRANSGNKEDTERVLVVLLLAAVCDGNFSKKKIAALRHSFDAAGVFMNLDLVRGLAFRFMHMDEITIDMVYSVVRNDEAKVGHLKVGICARLGYYRSLVVSFFANAL